MLDHWEISTDKAHLVLWDNAANTGKAMQEAWLPSLGCFAHSLQLVIEDDVLSQRAVIDVLATCRTIFGNFKDLSVAYGHLCAPFKSIWEFHNTVFNTMYIPDGTLLFIWLNL